MVIAPGPQPAPFQRCFLGLRRSSLAVISISRGSRHLIVWASICALALAASITSISNGYAFDDVHIIAENGTVHSLTHWWRFFAESYWPPAKGGDLYRPISMIGLAIQWFLGGGHPLVFHAVSIVLYALVCVAFTWVATAILPLGAAWLAGALFAVHPLHVEAVGNLVRQAELWAALFMFLAVGKFIRVRQSGVLSLADMLTIGALYALACLSKEHGIILPLLLMAAELTVTPRDRRLRYRWVEIRSLGLLLGAIGLAFVWAWTSVMAHTQTGGGESILFVDQSFVVRAMTMLRVALEWVRLFFWPSSLSADYSPRQIDVVTGPSLEMLPSAALLIGVAAIAWVTRRGQPVVTFAILWTAIALIIPSNLIIPTGFVLAERTLFVASAGAVLGVAAIAWHLMPRFNLSHASRSLGAAVLGAVLLLGVIKSAGRQRVWHDNPTLFVQTVRDAPASYKAHLAYATIHFDSNQRREGFEELEITYKLYPKDWTILEYAAEQYSKVGSCPVAVRLFRSVLGFDPGRPESRLGLAACLMELRDYEEARKVIAQGIVIGKAKPTLLRLNVINASLEATGHN
jgi:protein O-mannosyl-transferase